MYTKLKAIVNIIMINSQNVKSVQMSAVIITSVFREENSISAWMSSTEVTNTGLPKPLLNDQKSLSWTANNARCYME